MYAGATLACRCTSLMVSHGCVCVCVCMVTPQDYIIAYIRKYVLSTYHPVRDLALAGRTCC